MYIVYIYKQNLIKKNFADLWLSCVFDHFGVRPLLAIPLLSFPYKIAQNNAKEHNRQHEYQ
jgi:hypothetical protein